MQTALYTRATHTSICTIEPICQKENVSGKGVMLERYGTEEKGDFIFNFFVWLPGRVFK